jgi:cytidylate kinase
VRERDRRDSSRKASPLRPAEDAILIDTSEHSIDESLAVMLATLRIDVTNAAGADLSS